MPLVEIEAIVLRTYRLGEADKIVSLFTRQMGRARAVASGAQRTKSRYGGTLESLSYVRLWLYERENRDLGRLNSVEIIESFFDMQKDYSAHLAAQYLVEVAERLLPEKEVNERVFRLILATLRGLKRGVATKSRPISGANAVSAVARPLGNGLTNGVPLTPGSAIDRPLVYFDYWFLLVAGFLPDLERCQRCGRPLDEGYYGLNFDGLVCAACRTPMTQQKVGRDALALGTALRASSPDAWLSRSESRSAIRELRAFLESLIEFHAERKLHTLELLAEDAAF